MGRLAVRGQMRGEVHPDGPGDVALEVGVITGPAVEIPAHVAQHDVVAARQLSGAHHGRQRSHQPCPNIISHCCSLRGLNT